MKYKIPNKISKRELRKYGKSIIPLMDNKKWLKDAEKYVETLTDRIDDGRDRNDIVDSKGIRVSENDN